MIGDVLNFGMYESSTFSVVSEGCNVSFQFRTYHRLFGVN